MLYLNSLHLLPYPRRYSERGFCRILVVSDTNLELRYVNHKHDYFHTANRLIQGPA
jgi:hypothetical protein